MAQTIQEIYDQISDEVQNHPQLSELQPQIDDAQTLLSDLTSQSKVANWRLWKWVFAVNAWICEKQWDKFRSEVDNVVEAARWGLIPWWQEKALEWQYGHSLEYIDRKYQYAIDDVSAQIIKRSAAVESGRQVIVKVAKEDANQDPVKLSPDELTAFQSYTTKIRPPGTNTLIISYDPDLLNLSYTIYYDPAILDSQGRLLTDTNIKPVEDAINDYIKGIVWDGTYNITKSVDAIQAAHGVIDVGVGSQYGKANNASEYNLFMKEYRSVAGYMTIDPAFPLSTQINYIANV